MKKNSHHLRRYFVALILSSMIFLSGFFVSDILTSKKLEKLRDIENNISLSILSSETEYDILKEVSCDNLNNNILSKKVSELADNLSILESNNSEDARIIDAKKRYSLLLIKDYLLAKKVSEDCGTKPTFVIYFYQNADKCPSCVDTSASLSYLRKKYERMRVYAFDYELDLPIIKTLGTVYGINGNLPAVVINKKVYYGLTTKEQIDALLPKEIKEPLEVATSTATSTIKVKANIKK